MPEDSYAVIVSWSERDAAYIAEAPELPESAADGASYHEVSKVRLTQLARLARLRPKQGGG